MGTNWRLLPPPLTLGDIYLQPTGKNQRSRVRTLRRWRSTKPPVRDWAGLHIDILSCIFLKLTLFEILWPAQAVCRSWRQLALQPHVWRRIDMRNPVPLYSRDLEKLAMEALDRSGGVVEEFYAEGFGSDDLLSYMAERTTGLRCLVLISPSYRLSFKGLSKIASQTLEVLEITQNSGPLGPSFEGLTFEGLKFFHLNTKWYEMRGSYEYADNQYYYDCNNEALEIAKRMPNLCELQLVGNQMTNTGLHAIIDNCLNLEFLDIRECGNLSLDEFMKFKLGKIRTVRLPEVPIREKLSHWMSSYSYWSFDYDRWYDDEPSDYYDCDDYDFRVSSWECTGLKLQRKAYATVHSLW